MTHVLDAARDLARMYRRALAASDPDRCAQIDELARITGQGWAAPAPLPVPIAVLEDVRHDPMSPAAIEFLCGIPASTIRNWARRGLLTRHGNDPRRPKYSPAEVCAVRDRRRAVPAAARTA
jgi:hypothetical protein